MVERLEQVIRKCRLFLSRSEWGIRLLKLSRSTGTETRPGLLLIQIDGLSRNQLERSLERGEMPFLNSLLRREGYHLHTLYSGQPSSTPGFQAELFYGEKCAVPAFSFLNRKTGRVARMFDPEPVAAIQERLEKKHEGLLKEGSSYTGIFSGGAAESHFCPATFGWLDLLRAVNPFAIAILVLSHAPAIARLIGLLVLEIILALGDFLRGIIAGKSLGQELKFVPIRIAICILLRELVTIGGKMDLMRGLPTVHINFIGYDEQAHRRGPSSRFARWTLKGIDGAIRDLFQTARRSPRRDYDVWVYSDHGQEDTVPYPLKFGRTIQDAVAEALNHPDASSPLHPPEVRGIQYERSRWVNGRIGPPPDAEGKESPPGEDLSVSPLVVTAMGSLGHIYLSHPVSSGEKERMALRLTSEAHIPLVLAPLDNHGVAAWSGSVRHVLPQDAEQVLGAGHPFLPEVCRDLVDLCHHPDSGDFIISGWSLESPSICFPMEHGSHTGPGTEETRAFALLPLTSPVTYEEGKRYLRAGNLREGALRFLGRHPHPHPPRFRRRDREGLPLRVMTYNVHTCRGMDGKLAPDRIARVIAHYDPDIVALQELDVRRLRTRQLDQAHYLARFLEMEYHFYPALRVAGEQYGDAILSRFPMRLVKSGPLPGLPDHPRLEPRGALWISLTVGEEEIQVINTHLGLKKRERQAQVEALLGPEWLGHPDCRAPVILCGDFNFTPHSREFRKICHHYPDAQAALKDHRPQRTFTGRFPLGRIDHIFLDNTIRIYSVEVPRTAVTRVASDHLPLIAEIDIPRKTEITAAPPPP